LATKKAPSKAKASKASAIKAPAAKASSAKPAAKSAAKSASKPATKAVTKPTAKANVKSSASSSKNGGAKSPSPKTTSSQTNTSTNTTRKSNSKSAASKSAASKAGAKKPASASNGKAAAKPAAAKPAKAATKSPTKSPAKSATKSSTKSSTKSATKSSTKSSTKTPAKSESKPAAKAPAAVEPKSKSAAKAPAKPAVAAAVPAATAKGKSKAPAGKSPDGGGPDMPNVPKKGPIDTAQHKSVAVVAAAIANARGDDGSGYIMVNGRRVRAISTKGISLPKKSKAAASEAAPAPTDQQIASIKTKLSKKELDGYRVLLLAKRKQLVGMLNGMEDEALRSSGGNLSNMPVHMADMGSDVYDQDFTLGMAETERAILDEIDAALQRIADRTFGVCQMTGKPISKARLDAKPWAKYSIEAERIAEAGGAR
jgi:DnaK suppressor protein